MLSLERTAGRSKPYPPFAGLSRWIRPVSLRPARIGGDTGPAAARPGRAPHRPSRSCIQRPKRLNSTSSPGPYLARDARSEIADVKGRQALRPLPREAGGMLIFGPLWERPAGTQNTLAPNRRKARQLRHARQGLVRVPESNTKYGGKRRKTGAVSRL